MSLLHNAGASIRLGWEDYESDDDDRLLSAARNLHAGILLLYKEKLRRLSPIGSKEALLKQRIEPALDDKGNVTFTGEGKKTVDTQQIRTRFKSLKVDVVWSTLDSVSAIRNDIEHYFTTVRRDSVRAILSQTFLLFRDFSRIQLEEDPRELVGEAAWLAMTEISEIYEKERKECEGRIEAFEWTCSALKEAALGATCEECASPLIEPTGDDLRRPEVRCRSCGTTFEFEQFAEHAMVEHFGPESHVNIKDGGDPVVVTCPNCTSDAYHYESGICAVCEESTDHECAMCSLPIPIGELNYSGLCGWCSHKLSKDD